MAEYFCWTHEGVKKKLNAQIMWLDKFNNEETKKVHTSCKTDIIHIDDQTYCLFDETDENWPKTITHIEKYLATKNHG